MRKLGVIVPYRNREEQLELFQDIITKFLDKTLTCPYVIIVVDQIDKKEFNRGKLLNIGFKEAKEQDCDYVIFHDVDMLPIEGDYSYSNKPLQIANNFVPDGDFTRVIQRNYFGGATLFPVEDFEKINGYSNKYKGWGFEDDDLLLRCREQNLELENEPYRTLNFDKKAIYFNGKNSYIKLHNIYRTIRPFSIITTFYPDNIDCNPSEITDEYTLFSIPGHDMNITFNSFSRYKYELFLKDNTPVTLTSDYLPPLPVQVVVNVNPRKKRIQYFINGKEVETKYWGDGVIRLYEEEPYMYIGSADPSRKGKENFFKGHLLNLGILHGELTQEQVKSIYLKDANRPINFVNPDLVGRWNGYWDSASTIDSEEEFTLTDTSEYSNHGWGYNCELKDIKSNKVTREKYPYRRKSLHKLYKHDERGYTDGYWKSWSSRENQLRYYRLVNSGDSNFSKDGLNNCKYRIRSKEHDNNIIKLKIIT